MNIPENIKRGIDRHVEHGIKPGDFTEGVLTNDLSKAVGHADPISIANLKDIIIYCHNDIPPDCWGSPKKVKAWREKIHRAVEKK